MKKVPRDGTGTRTMWDSCSKTAEHDLREGVCESIPSIHLRLRLRL